uniref:hypothetical protein n=2 Tax=unclassified Brevundimonas TaxID=2622653 RepID=UPI003CE6D91D
RARRRHFPDRRPDRFQPVTPDIHTDTIDAIGANDRGRSVGELPRGYVPLSHAIFDRIVADLGILEMTALLDDGTRPPEPVYPEDFVEFVKVTSTERFDFASVTIDQEHRKYRYLWRSRHRTEDDQRNLIRRPDRHFEVSPWGPFDPLPFSEQGDLHYRLMSRAAALWNGHAKAVLGRLAEGQPVWGRVGSLTSPHQAIGWDVWPALAVTDVGSGKAETKDGSVSFFSIHAPAPARIAAKLGRPSSEDKIIAAIRKLRPDGDYKEQEKLRYEVQIELARKTEIPISTLKKALKAIRENG